MTWRVKFSKKSIRFMGANNLKRDDIHQLIETALLFFAGQDVNVDLKKLKGRWLGFFRIRKGKLRIIAGFDFNNTEVFIEAVDWRGNVYK